MAANSRGSTYNGSTAKNKHYFNSYADLRLNTIFNALHKNIKQNHGTN